MLLPTAVAIVLISAQQSPAVERQHAEELTRDGRSAEAIAIVEKIVAADPADTDARSWFGRLALRLGRTADAEAAFRAVLSVNPRDVDARIGLGMALTRAGQEDEALEILRAAENDAGENADLFAALARAYRRNGDDRAALSYFERARALSPRDPDITLGYEAVGRTYGHWFALDGFNQTGAAEAWSGAVVGNLRLSSRVHVQGSLRVQEGSGYSDAIGGGGLLWRAGTATTVSMQVLGGNDNVALARRDASVDVIHYAGAIEIGGSARQLAFTAATVSAASATGAWNLNDRWRVDGRYTFSRSVFEAGEASADHSVMVRETWQGWRRIALLGTYAYGIESFEDLTVERLRSLGTTTLAAGLRIDVPSLTRITTTWEHQWRSNDTKVDRLVLSVVQVFP